MSEDDRMWALNKRAISQRVVLGQHIIQYPYAERRCFCTWPGNPVA
jgi:hypothetical protein